MYYDSYDSVQWENESNIRIIIIFDVLFLKIKIIHTSKTNSLSYML